MRNFSNDEDVFNSPRKDHAVFKRYLTEINGKITNGDQKSFKTTFQSLFIRNFLISH